MRLFVTGASGYFGSNLLPRLLEAGHKPVCLIRKGSEKKIKKYLKDIEIISGGISDLPSWKDQLKDIDAFINLIGIIREFPSRGITFERLHFKTTKSLADLASEKGVNRFLQMSALGASPDSRSGYHRTKYKAEQYLKDTDLDWTIFRPAFIIGKGNDFVETVLNLMDSAPLFPVIGNGEYRMQPTDVDNVTEGFVKSLTEDVTIGKIYEIGGPDRFSYNRMVDLIAEARGKKARKIHLPVFMMKGIAGAFEYFKSFPLTRDQINMLLEENYTDSREFFEDLNITPIIFDESIKKAL
ncbi:MAG: complex I NDUFA9 subunit family protein [candidate division Zixibacteria bacterium]|jgi:NADH dehydrogenase|nr:complex I NDUFA9 subunit family protein [candidate division Zixibacteria bacterium]NIR63345.1 complex I NDUFA9 subunit family protein [candidate division Zixibacteria bacterium]NIS17354.1 complex I NDUFA9 subunit family protein [candidate division Zixibacteria bacterium]NIS45327.1 complex I NDUFA9 subunit family protein [candidate division Zixibacteria bacterium]NIT53699.1 complex I NDUFA9 subunit family protein [candidate division Zixibacteria bacterium]